MTTLLALTTPSFAGASKLVLNDGTLRDQRVVNLDGVYALPSAAPFACTLTIIQDDYLGLAVTIAINGTGAPVPFPLSARLKPIGSQDMQLLMKGKGDNGWSAEMVGEFAGGPTHFNMHVVLTGPDGVTEYDSVLTPIDSSHTFHLYGKHDVDGKATWLLTMPGTGAIDGIITRISKLTTPTKLKAKAPGISLSVAASVNGMETVSPYLIPAAGDSTRLKIGKVRYLIYQINWDGITVTPE
jgi:hypothetical protein